MATTSSPHVFRAAVLQMVSGKVLAENLQQAEALLIEAATQGCQVAVLPENFAVMGLRNTREFAELESSPGPILDFLARTSRALGLWIVAGSLPYLCSADGKAAPKGKVYTSSGVWNTSGECIGRYDKIHLFDVDVADGVGQYRESDQFAPGGQPVTVKTPWTRFGLSICYDLRFPELYRYLVKDGAEVLCAPSAFTYQTGEAHWQVLLRCRAIENQCYMLAANQGGQHSQDRQTWGHSSIVDPWGKVVAECESPGPGIAVAEINLAHLRGLRQRMPSQQHRKL